MFFFFFGRFWFCFVCSFWFGFCVEGLYTIVFFGGVLFIFLGGRFWFCFFVVFVCFCVVFGLV